MAIDRVVFSTSSGVGISATPMTVPNVCSCRQDSCGATRERAPACQTTVVEPRPDGRWARQKNGTQRAASLHNTQALAERAARAQAKRERTELVVEDQRGKIQRRDSFGNDPYPPRG